MMKRLAPLLPGLLLLSACARLGTLSPEEVLRRATAASARLQSVAYDARVVVAARGPAPAGDITGDLRGVLAQAGRQAAMSADVRGSVDRSGAKTTFQLSADAVHDARDLYVLVHTMTVNPVPSVLRGIGGLLGKWWKIPVDGPSMAGATALTPDPLLLRAQADVVTVTADHGHALVNGREVYRYAVTIDPEKLIAFLAARAEETGRPFDAVAARKELARYDAAGELWIDVHNFLLHRLAWTITAKDASTAQRVHFAADLRQHDAAPPVTVPSDAAILPPTLPLDALLPFPVAGLTVDRGAATGSLLSP